MKSLSNKNPGPVIEIPETSLKKSENNTQNDQVEQLIHNCVILLRKIYQFINN